MFIRILIWIVVLGLIAGGAYYGYEKWTTPATPTLRTAVVKRGDLSLSISATGTVVPEEVIDVGAQVAGKIKAFGEDPHNAGASIDYGSLVSEGTILALIDDSLYAADVASNLAELEQAQANVLRAQADRDSRIAAQAQAVAAVELAQIEVNHLNNVPADAQSRIEMETAEAQLRQAQAALGSAKANVAVADAVLTQTQKAVSQQEATLGRARTNLDYCTIRSPVDGVIIDRRVNIGQTVVSSLSAPSLFLIAKDLRRMEIWAAVNEAEIGGIHPDQPVSFSVDAFPGRTFQGKVNKVRLNASMTQNVVTYTVEIRTDNSDGALLPYLTANVQFEVDKRNMVLQVPNSALRFTPPTEFVAPDARQKTDQRDDRDAGGASASRPARGGAGGERKRERDSETKRTIGTIWIVDGEFVRPVPVQVGLGNSLYTEISGDGVTEGATIAVGVNARESGSSQTTNPFTPQMNRRPQR